MFDSLAIAEHAGRFLKSTIVGVLATLADLAALALLVEVTHLTPNQANVPALLIGATVQFLGCRYFIFEGADGALSKQLRGFAIAEAATLFLNGVLFAALTTFTPLPYALCRALGTFLVFVSFSFPAWSKVFKRAP